MKKILSLILVAIMLVTAMPIAMAEGTTYKVGDIIQFGSYPQSKVTDEALVAELNALAPEWEDWTSYGYYSGDDKVGSMVQGDWMRYTDINYNGNKYRGVKFTQYRPVYTYLKTDILYAYQYYNGYSIDTVYWFKYDPINWQVLDPTTGLVICETIVDSQAYNDTIYVNNNEENVRFKYYNDVLYTTYASNYETSSLRKWLNEDFYNTAFTDSEKKAINTTTINNDSYYTSIGELDYTTLDSRETEDKIFHISYNDVKNSNYGFDSDPFNEDIVRQVQGSDYAQSQGLFVSSGLGESYDGCSSWFLRTGGHMSASCCCVGAYGGFFYAYDVSETSCGVRPALCFKDIENLNHEHTYNEYVTPPTCKDQGYTTYICGCGDKYVANYVGAVDHKDDNKDYLCDYDCGYEFEKPAPEVPEDPDTPDTPHEPDTPDVPEEPDVDDTPDEPCTCKCHGNFIQRLFFKLINFFQKLFGMNKVCACGVKH